MTRDEAVAALRDASRERALIYLAIFRELSVRQGPNEAVDVMRTALFAHGKRFGESLRHTAPANFRQLYQDFATVPDGGDMFSPREIRCDGQCLDVQFMTCPLKSAWQDAGVSDDDLETLLYCASALDEGTMEAAGFDVQIALWKRGQTGCCRLTITPKATVEA